MIIVKNRVEFFNTVFLFLTPPHFVVLLFIKRGDYALMKLMGKDISVHNLPLILRGVPKGRGV
jgi:hypothetical protein